MNNAELEMRLPRSTPESQGIPSTAIEAFLLEAEENLDHLHSFMVLRHGEVVAEGWWKPFAAQVPHMLYSLSKSFTSSAVGLAVEEGLLSIDDRVVSFFPDEAPSQVSKHLDAMRVRHLLSMNTGHAEDSTAYLRDSQDGNWVRAFLARPVEHEPGSFFLYDSGASYILSAIVQKLTGQTLVEYLQPRLFTPLGIENPVWDTCPRGINTGGWGLYLRTEDIACFGQMLLDKGVWKGQVVLREAWIDTATAFHSDNSNNDQIDWQQGYGFQFWRCQHNAYRGDGAFGQFCVVMPDQDAVFVATAGVPDMQAVLDLVWKHLLPAMGAEPLTEDSAAVERLRARLGALALPPLADAGPKELEPSLSGREFTFEPVEDGVRSLVLRFNDSECRLILRDELGEHKVVCGRGKWSTGMTEGPAGSASRVAASSGWQEDGTLAIKLCYYDTPHDVTLQCRFDGEEVTVERVLNVSFGPTQLPRQTGRASRTETV